MLGVVTSGRNAENTEVNMQVAIAVHLQALREDGEDIAEPTSTLDTYNAEGDEQLRLVEPLPMNPVSLEIDRLIRESGLSQAEVARRLDTSRAAVSRLADPFYWGHSLAVLRRLGERQRRHPSEPRIILKRDSRHPHHHPHRRGRSPPLHPGHPRA